MAVEGIVDTPPQVVALRPDSVMAQELRDEIAPALEVICRAYDKARAAGLHMGFTVSPDQFGRKHRVAEVTVFRPL